MTHVLVVYGSRHGGTRGIAERIGDALRGRGLDATVAAAEDGPDVAAADALVIGSGVYMGSWLKEPLELMQRNHAALADRPVWLFSSGPLRGSTAAKSVDDPPEDALGPTSGPGSGGRKKVNDAAAGIDVRDHAVFYGAFDPADPPKALSERLVRSMPGSKGILPPGDFRDWPLIDAWAESIARELKPAEVPA